MVLRQRRRRYVQEPRHEIKRHVPFLNLIDTPPIPHPPQLVSLGAIRLGQILILKVLPPWTPQRLDAMQRRPRPQARDFVRLAIPRPALIHEDGALEVGVDDTDKVAHAACLGGHGLDLLLLLLADAFDNVVARGFYHHGQRARADGGVGTEHDVEVGEAVRGERQIRLGATGPVVRQTLATQTRDGERRRRRGVEACRADQHVYAVHPAVRSHHALGLDADDSVAHKVDVVLDQRFEEARAGRQASAPRREVGLEVLVVLWFLLQSLLHPLLKLLLRALLHLRPLDCQSVDLVAAGFNLHPEIVEILGVVAETLFVFVRKRRRGYTQGVLSCLGKRR